MVNWALLQYILFKKKTNVSEIRHGVTWTSYTNLHQTLEGYGADGQDSVSNKPLMEKGFEVLFLSFFLVKVKFKSIVHFIKALCCVLPHSVEIHYLLFCLSSVVSLWSKKTEGWKQTSKGQRGIRTYLPVCSAMSKARTIMASSISFIALSELTCKTKIKKNWFNFFHLRKCAC